MITAYSNKRYQKHNIVEDTDIFKGYVSDMEVDTDILNRLSKDLGFSYELYRTLSKIDELSATIMVKSLSTHNKYSEINLLIDDDKKQIIGYSLDTERPPILNSEFIKRVISIADTSDEVELSEVYYHKDDKIASVILKKKSPIQIEEKYQDKESNIINYDIGVLIVNDEEYSAYSRLVLYVDDQPLYLPASYYNSTNIRYKRSTPSSVEALEVLLLKIIDDLREETMYNKVYDIHYKYRLNKYILSSYEEYTTLLRTMRKIPTIIEDNSLLDSLVSKYEDFEKKYPHVEDQKSSYIWRCTALSDIPVGALISITSQILSELSAPPIEYLAIRELLGTYISTNRIADEIAKEDTH